MVSQETKASAEQIASAVPPDLAYKSGPDGAVLDFMAFLFLQNQDFRTVIYSRMTEVLLMLFNTACFPPPKPMWKPWNPSDFPDDNHNLLVLRMLSTSSWKFLVRIFKHLFFRKKGSPANFNFQTSSVNAVSTEGISSRSAGEDSLQVAVELLLEVHIKPGFVDRLLINLLAECPDALSMDMSTASAVTVASNISRFFTHLLSHPRKISDSLSSSCLHHMMNFLSTSLQNLVQDGPVSYQISQIAGSIQGLLFTIIITYTNQTILRCLSFEAAGTEKEKRDMQSPETVSRERVQTVFTIPERSTELDDCLLVLQQLNSYFNLLCDNDLYQFSSQKLDLNNLNSPIYSGEEGGGQKEKKNNIKYFVSEMCFFLQHVLQYVQKQQQTSSDDGTCRGLQDAALAVWIKLIRGKADLLADILFPHVSIVQEREGINRVTTRNELLTRLQKSFVSLSTDPDKSGTRLQGDIGKDEVSQVLNLLKRPLPAQVSAHERKSRLSFSMSNPEQKDVLLHMNLSGRTSIANAVEALLEEPEQYKSRMRDEFLQTNQQFELMQMMRLRNQRLDARDFFHNHWKKLSYEIKRRAAICLEHQLGSSEMNSNLATSNESAEFILDRWKVEFTQGPFRQLKKRQRDHDFYSVYGIDFEHLVTLEKRKGLDVADLVHGQPKERKKGRDSSSKESDSTSDLNKSKRLPQSGSNLSGIFYGVKNAPWKKLRKFLEPCDQPGPKDMFNCHRIDGLELKNAIVVIGEEYLYVVDDFDIDSQGMLSETRVPSASRKFSVKLGYGNLGNDNTADQGVIFQVQKILKNRVNASSVSPKSVGRECQKWPYTAIQDVFTRNYQLRQVAMEIFHLNGTHFMLVFATQSARNSLHSRLQSLLSTENMSQNNPLSISFIGADTVNQPKSRSPLSLLTQFQWNNSLNVITNKWKTGQISNFAYLMLLNTLAGRTYNDLKQYPVFPWVLQDYYNQELDLGNPNVYRDLSKPMGALSPKRAKRFEERYESFYDPTRPEVPKFHYGTHYSSSAVVLFFLFRLEPFSQVALDLQGGKFDHADRLFASVAKTWQNASGFSAPGDEDQKDGFHGLTDVKELIPEWYSLPDLFINLNRFDLGETQSGRRVHNVELPPWARGDPKIFVRILRRALESRYVSSNLHNWIDLIFGYKQRGNAAVEALNVFRHTAYSGAIDIDAISDPLMKQATIDEIDNFGQTPEQLFTRPHPQRKVFASCETSNRLSDDPASAADSSQIMVVLRPDLVRVGDEVAQLSTRQPVRAIFWDGNRLVTVGGNKCLLPPKYALYVNWNNFSCGIRFYTYFQPSSTFKDQLLASFEGLHKSPVTCVRATDDGQTLIVGCEDATVAVYEVIKPIVGPVGIVLRGTLSGHLGPITHLAACTTYKLLATGSADKFVFLWDLQTLECVCHLPCHPHPISAIAIDDVSGDIATCSGSFLAVWDVNGDFLAAKNIKGTVRQSKQAYPDSLKTFSSTITPPVTSRSRSSSMTTPSKSSGSPFDTLPTDSSPATGSLRPLVVTSVDFLSGGSTGAEWVIATGHADGSLRMWALEMPTLASRRMGPDLDSEELYTFLFPGAASTSPADCMYLASRAVLFVSKHPITCIHCSHNELSRFWAGDNKGTVYELFARNSREHWIRDEEMKVCAGLSCSTRFTVIERKHHCRRCGMIFCGRCSSKSCPVPALGFYQAVRVCDPCFADLSFQANPMREAKGNLSAEGELVSSSSLDAGAPAFSRFSSVLSAFSPLTTFSVTSQRPNQQPEIRTANTTISASATTSTNSASVTSGSTTDTIDPCSSISTFEEVDPPAIVVVPTSTTAASDTTSAPALAHVDTDTCDSSSTGPR